MAILQQADSQLAQKQIRKVVPISIQNQKAVDMRGQNNEATIKAVQDAIEVSAQVYKKMDDASVDLELKEEETNMKVHFNKQDVLLSNNIGVIGAGSLKPDEFKKQYEGEEGKYGFGKIASGENGYLTPYKASEGLSDRAKAMVEPFIKRANSDFVGNAQKALSKELRMRGEKNLAYTKKELNDGYATELSTLTKKYLENGDFENGVDYRVKSKVSAEKWNKEYEAQVTNKLNLMQIKEVDAKELIRQNKEDLALIMLTNHLAIDPEKAYKNLKEEEFYKVSGVGISKRQRLDFMNRHALQKNKQDKSDRYANFVADVDLRIGSKGTMTSRVFMNKYYTLENVNHLAETAITENSYTIRKDDTFVSIAKKLKISYEDLTNDNAKAILKSDGHVIPGTKLKYKSASGSKNSTKILVPNKELVAQWASKSNVRFEDAIIYFKQIAKGRTHSQNNGSLNKGILKDLYTSTDSWYDSKNQYANSVEHGDNPYNIASKNGTFELMSNDQQAKYETHHDNLLKIRHLSNSYRRMTIDQLNKTIKLYKTDLTSAGKNNDDIGKSARAIGNLTSLLANTITPYLDAVTDDPAGWIKAQLKIDLDKPITDSNLIKEFSNMAKILGRPDLHLLSKEEQTNSNKRLKLVGKSND